MKMAKRTLSTVLALIMAFGMFSIVSSSAPAPADYTAVENAISTQLPSVANRYFYIDEVTGLIDTVLDSINWELETEDQTVVDGYVAMINDLGALLKTTVTDGSQSPLEFAYGTGFTFQYMYPYGASELAFYPLRDEQKAVNTLALEANKTVVPLVNRYADDQNFTVKVSLGSNALLCAGSIPVLFDKTRLEVVGVDNSANNVTLTPTMIGTNLAQEYDFATILNPDTGFWPAVYENDAEFKAQWAGISIILSTNFDDGTPYSVLPIEQEEFLLIEFKVKVGAPAGEAIVYVDEGFKRDANNRNNALYLGRAENEDSFETFDDLCYYGATINTAAAVATVEIMNVILGDTNLNGSVTATDALMVMQANAGLVTLSEKQMLQGNVDIGGFKPWVLNVVDALKILQFASGLINEF